MAHCNIRAISFSLVFLLFSATLASGCKIYYFTTTFKSPPTHAEQAEALVAEGKRAEAIEEYKKHVRQRVAFVDRPADENPYFYYILIGDLQLELGDPDLAEQAYLTALENKVHPDLVGDRIRRLSSWYADQGQFDTAIELLKTHRELDELVFDGHLDEIHKRAVAAEDEQKLDENSN